MSFEQLLLIAFFVVLPLIQFVMRLLREPHELPKQPGSPRPPAPRLPTQELPPAAEDHARFEAAALSERKPARKSDRSEVPAIRPSARRGPAIVGLRDRLDLRRAIVLMTVIGPCRAVDPHD